MIKVIHEKTGINFYNVPQRGRRRSRAIGNHLFNGSEGQRAKSALSEDIPTAATITKVIRGITNKATGSIAKAEYTSSHEKKLEERRKNQ